MFGTPKKSFSIEKLRKLESEDDITEIKNYINSYFIKIKDPICILHWEPATKRYLQFKIEDVKKTLLKKPNKKETWDYQHWFFNTDSNFYMQTMEPHKPKTFEIAEQKFLNLFPGFIHNESKKYDDFDVSIKKKVKFIWSHVKEVLCSGNEDQYIYLKNWACHMINGRKMKTCIYCKGVQGSGKSQFTEFIAGCVLGEKLVLITQDSKLFTSEFNGELYGKMLVVLEEPPNETQGKWHSFSNSLKNPITGSILKIRDLYKTAIQTENIMSLMINTNNNAIRIDADDRRFVVIDVSNHRVGDFEYFKQLNDYTTDPKVGEAFYWYAKEFAEQNKNFRENVIPSTQSKKDLIVENLNSLLNFMKMRYVKYHKGIDKTFKKFYTEYTLYCTETKGDLLSKIAVSKNLANIGIKVLTGNANIALLKVDPKTLFDLFKNKGWIHDIDEIPDYENEEIYVADLEIDDDSDSDYSPYYNGDERDTTYYNDDSDDDYSVYHNNDFDHDTTYYNDDSDDDYSIYSNDY